MPTKSVVLMQDGAVDELISVLLLSSMEDVSIRYIDVLNADCVGYPTYVVTRKLLRMIGAPDDDVFLSNARGWNPFPWTYRQYSMMTNLLPMVNQYRSDISIPDPPPASGMMDILQRLQSEGTGVTFVVLSPLTDMAEVVSTLDDPKSLIDSIVWMGGAYSNDPKKLPAGNIDTGIAPGANPNAEWNAYWDPQALQTVLESGVPLSMFPLNVTNSVLLTPEIIRDRFLKDSRDYALLDLAAQMYSTVAFEAGFSFWDTVTTAYVDQPGLFEMTPMTISVDTGVDPTKQGTITPDAGGYPVEMATSVDVPGFYDYLVRQLKTLSARVRS